MIVTCERCATQFQLDDARVPESGVRVRCSRCKHAFEIRKSAPAGPSGASDDEEADWQFNEDPPRGHAAGGSRGSAASVIDDLLGGANPGPAEDDGESLFGSASPSGLELSDASPRTAEPTAAKPMSAGPHRDASPIAGPQAGPSGLDLAGEEAQPEPPPKPKAKPLLIQPDPVADLATDLADELREEVPPAAPAVDELSTADWDLLAGSEVASETPAGTSASSLGSGRPRTLEVDPDELIDDRPRWRSALDGAGHGAGWLVVVLLFAFGVRGGLLSGPGAPQGLPAGSQAAGVELRDPSARFVDHAAAGWVYVVSGRLENTGSRPVAPGTLAVELIDRSGKALTSPAPAAAPLSAEAMRVGRIEGPWRHSPALRPGESRAFQAVLAPPPPGARGLRLTTVAARLAEEPLPDAAPEPDAATLAEAAASPGAVQPAEGADAPPSQAESASGSGSPPPARPAP